MRLRAPRRPEYVPRHFRYVGPTLLQRVRSASWVEAVAWLRTQWRWANPWIKAVAGVVYLAVSALVIVSLVQALDSRSAAPGPRPSFVTPSPTPGPVWPPVR